LIKSPKDAKDFIENYGTHVISECHMGGALSLSWKVDRQAKETSVNHDIDVALSFVQANFSFDIHREKSSFFHALKVSMLGGEHFLVGLQNREVTTTSNGETITVSKPEPNGLTEAKLTKWLDSLNSKNTMVSFRATPIYMLLPQGGPRNILMNVLNYPGPKELTKIEFLCEVDVEIELELTRDGFTFTKKSGKDGSKVQSFAILYKNEDDQEVTAMFQDVDWFDETLTIRFFHDHGFFKPASAPIASTIKMERGKSHMKTRMDEGRYKTILTIRDAKMNPGAVSVQGTVRWQ